jgi:hypothetical protein
MTAVYVSYEARVIVHRYPEVKNFMFALWVGSVVYLLRYPLLGLISLGFDEVRQILMHTFISMPDGVDGVVTFVDTIILFINHLSLSL